jgi:hypothetical protein
MDTAKMKTPTLEPLRSAIAAVQKLSKEIAESAARHAADAEELRVLSESGAGPDDESALAKVAQLQGRLALTPGYKRRLEGHLAEAVKTLESAAEKARQEVQALAEAEATRLVDEIEVLLRPYAPTVKEANGEKTNQARRLAEACPKVGAVRTRGTPQGSWPQHISRENDPARFDQNALEFASSLLALLSSVEANGSFLPANWGRE